MVDVSSLGEVVENFGAGDDLLQAVGVGREILGDLQGSGEVGDGHEAGGTGVGVDELGGGLAGVDLHAQVDGRVIEKEDEIMALGLGLGGLGLGGETLDGLLLAVLEDAEFFSG